MSSIRELPEAVYARIAAGEVIVNPAAAVKELIENSLDADANGITVEIVDGGKDFIRVTDNGAGISSADLPLAVARHATSKIAEFADLYELHSFGFRGEALSSMAEVSRLTVLSRERGTDEGTRLTVNGGSAPTLEPAGAPEGTTVRLEDLFYNVPARRKFLKTGGREGAQVCEVVRRAILSAPDVAFKLIRNRRIVYQSPGSGGLRAAVSSVYGRECLSELIDIDWNERNCRVTGVISRPTYALKTAKRIDFYVNNRYIQSRTLQKALMRGYGESMLRGHYPCAVLNIEIDPGMVDINVHPAKLSAIFLDDDLVCDAVANAVSHAAGTNTGAPYIPIARSEHITSTAPPDSAMDLIHGNKPEHLPQDVYTPSCTAHNHTVNSPDASDRHTREAALPSRSDPHEQTMSTEPSCTPAPYISESLVDKASIAAFQELLHAGQYSSIDAEAQTMDIRSLSRIHILGSVFATYVVVESDERLFFIDQHAARERLTYEQILAWTRQSEKYSQMLLIPVIRTFRAPDFDVLSDNAAMLEELGIQFEEFGELTLRFLSFPVQIDATKVDSFLSDIIAELNDHPDDPLVARDRLIASACRHSVKSGTKLTKQEMETLVREITQMDAIPFCPHGRPIAVEITRDQLEKGFKRRV